MLVAWSHTFLINLRVSIIVFGEMLFKLVYALLATVTPRHQLFCSVFSTALTCVQGYFGFELGYCVAVAFWLLVFVG